MHVRALACYPRDNVIGVPVVGKVAAAYGAFAVMGIIEGGAQLV